MVFGRRKKQQSSTSTNSLFISPQRSCLKQRNDGSIHSSIHSNTTPPHRVQFGPVRIREYERIIGCNPSCSNGAPIGIGWRYVDKETPVSILAMERNPHRRQHKADLVLSRQERESLLLEWGFTLPEIVESIRATIRIKHQRRRTVNNARYERVWEDVVVKPASRIKKKFRKSNKTPNEDDHHHHYSPHSMDVPADLNTHHHHLDCPPKTPPRFVEDSTEDMEDESMFPLDKDHRVVYIQQQEEISSAGTLGSDGNFELLERDTSFWELERNNPLYPKIARKALAIVVSDEPMDDCSDTDPGAYGHQPYFLPRYPTSRWDQLTSYGEDKLPLPPSLPVRYASNQYPNSEHGKQLH